MVPISNYIINKQAAARATTYQYQAISSEISVHHLSHLCVSHSSSSRSSSMYLCCCWCRPYSHSASRFESNMERTATANCARAIDSSFFIYQSTGRLSWLVLSCRGGVGGGRRHRLVVRASVTHLIQLQLSPRSDDGMPASSSSGCCGSLFLLSCKTTLVVRRQDNTCETCCSLSISLSPSLPLSALPLARAQISLPDLVELN